MVDMDLGDAYSLLDPSSVIGLSESQKGWIYFLLYGLQFLGGGGVWYNMNQNGWKKRTHLNPVFIIPIVCAYVFWDSWSLETLAASQGLRGV